MNQSNNENFNIYFIIEFPLNVQMGEISWEALIQIKQSKTNFALKKIFIYMKNNKI